MSGRAHLGWILRQCAIISANLAYMYIINALFHDKWKPGHWLYTPQLVQL